MSNIIQRCSVILTTCIISQATKETIAKRISMTVHRTLVRMKANVWMELEHTTASALQDLMEPIVSTTLMNVSM